MNIYKLIYTLSPDFLLEPKENHKTISGLKLKINPSLEDVPEIKFAAMDHLGFHQKNNYHKLIPFIPKEFEIVGEPNGQNCYMYCLNINPKIIKKFERKDFLDQLEKEKFETLSIKNKLNLGDIITYSIPHPFYGSIINHVGIYVGDDNVKSRWGYNSPLIKHPLREVIPDYWNGDEKYLSIERK